MKYHEEQTNRLKAKRTRSGLMSPQSISQRSGYIFHHFLFSIQLRKLNAECFYTSYFDQIIKQALSRTKRLNPTQHKTLTCRAVQLTSLEVASVGLHPYRDGWTCLVPTGQQQLQLFPADLPGLPPVIGLKRSE